MYRRTAWFLIKWESQLSSVISTSRFPTDLFSIEMFTEVMCLLWCSRKRIQRYDGPDVGVDTLDYRKGTASWTWLNHQPAPGGKTDQPSTYNLMCHHVSLFYRGGMESRRVRCSTWKERYPVGVDFHRLSSNTLRHHRTRERQNGLSSSAWFYSGFIVFPHIPFVSHLTDSGSLCSEGIPLVSCALFSGVTLRSHWLRENVAALVLIKLTSLMKCSSIAVI